MVNVEKTPQLRTFDQLNKAEKILAVLAATRYEPKSKDLVLFLAGINYQRLGNDDRQAVDNAFNQKDVVLISNNGLYQMTRAAARSILKNVDVLSVQRQCSQVP